MFIQQDIIDRNKLSEPVFVTRPVMPPLNDYKRLLEEVWENRWLTNNGVLHERLEKRLGAVLDVDHLSLFCNGTSALEIALRALGVEEGEVITTPFTFPATTHIIHWLGLRPVFCDVDPVTLNLDPNRVEEAITPRTRAILPVHVYGTPCDVEAFEAISRIGGLRLIYDAAHAFRARFKNRALADYGDAAILSFHATKIFSTGEGGALIFHERELKRRADLMRNFGIAGQEEILGPGVNGKMSEFQAAFGLLQLDLVDHEIEQRRNLISIYKRRLIDVPGLKFLPELPGLQRNHAYCPIRVNLDRFGLSRDDLHVALCQMNVKTRKYFSPLCSSYPCYRDLPSAAPWNLPVAMRAASEVLCLPLYGGLDEAIVERICTAILEIHHMAVGGKCSAVDASTTR